MGLFVEFHSTVTADEIQQVVEAFTVVAAVENVLQGNRGQNVPLGLSRTDVSAFGPDSWSEDLLSALRAIYPPETASSGVVASAIEPAAPSTGS
jgi:hypothetical protein